MTTQELTAPSGGLKDQGITDGFVAEKLGQNRGAAGQEVKAADNMGYIPLVVVLHYIPGPTYKSWLLRIVVLPLHRVADALFYSGR